jgi:hypothetical protein
MLFTTVRLERPEGTVLLRGIPVQLEQAAPDDLARLDLDGARPYDIFWLYTTQGVPGVPLRRRDLLTDELNADPETGQLARYRVAGVVETIDNDHQEALCQRIVGN